MNDEIYSDGGFEDISSSTVPRTKSSLKAVTENYGNGVFKHLDKIIKAISFIVAHDTFGFCCGCRRAYYAR